MTNKTEIATMRRMIDPKEHDLFDAAIEKEMGIMLVGPGVKVEGATMYNVAIFEITSYPVLTGNLNDDEVTENGKMNKCLLIECRAPQVVRDSA